MDIGDCGMDVAMKPTEREAELRRQREEVLAAEEERRVRDEVRRKHYEEVARREAVTEVSRNNEDNVTKRMDIVTKINHAGKRGRGRPPLLGKKMSDAERARRYRARKKAEGK